MLRPNALACSGDRPGKEQSGEKSGKSARSGRSGTVAKLRAAFGRQSVRESRQSERGSNWKSEGAERRVKREHSERIAEKPVEYAAGALPATEKPSENCPTQKTEIRGSCCAEWAARTRVQRTYVRAHRERPSNVPHRTDARTRIYNLHRHIPALETTNCTRAEESRAHSRRVPQAPTWT